MRALSASDQLRVWERGRRQNSAGRALIMLAAAEEIPVDELSEIPVGQRDARLLELRERIFGPRIEAVTACPGCGESLELTFETGQLRSSGVEEEPGGRTYLLEHEGYEVSFRTPDSNDLQAIAGCETTEAARELLLERCIGEIRHTGDNGELENRADRLPAGVIKELVEMMAKIDPQANVRLGLTCPGCQHEWPAIFDIASFIWSEVNDQAKRLLREVHTLASAYGWGESEIVEMSAERRAIYMEMLGGA